MEKIEIGRYRYTGKPLRLGNCKLKTGDIIKVKDFGFGYVSVIVYFDIERLPKYNFGIGDYVIKRHLQKID